MRRSPGAALADFDRVCSLEDLDELLPQADIVVGCLPDTPETRGLLTCARLHAMKPDAVFVNVGRGSLVATDDLIAVRLQNGVAHLRDVNVSLQAQILRQLVGVDARFLHIVRDELAVLHQNDGLTAEKAADGDAAVYPHRQQQLDRQHDQNRDQPREQRDRRVLHRHGREVRDEHRHNELRGFHLPDLTLSHHADDQNERQIQDHGA